MKLHGNARTCPKSRRLLVERIESRTWSLTSAAEAAGVSERTAYRWLARWRAEGEVGLVDRSCAPSSVPNRTPADRVAVIESLLRLRMTAAEIAEVLGMALSTVSAVLSGSARRSKTKNTYTADGRRIGDAGWEFVQVAVDDATRLAYAEVLPTNKALPQQRFSSAPSGGSPRSGLPSNGSSQAD